MLSIGLKSPAGMVESDNFYHHRVRLLADEIAEKHPYEEGLDPRIGAAIDDLKKTSEHLRKANI